MKRVSQSQLLPEVIARLGRLEIRAHHIVEGIMSGLHRSPYFGQSIEFLQHRQYVPGDDLRHVDWKVWAKQDRLYVKQYEEDTNLRCTLLVDASASMAYGGGAMTKYEYAATAAAALALLLLRQQDAVSCLTFADQVRQKVPLRTSRSHLTTILQALDTGEPQAKTGLGDVLRAAAETYPRRGMMVLLSDLLADVDETLKGLRMLRQRGHDVLVLHVMDDDELDFPFTGPARFEGLESDVHLRCNPRALREAYLASLDTFLGSIRRGCAADGVQYALIRSSDPFDVALLTLLSRRVGAWQRGT
jgi:uncharacterized protein (DUF58 family)